MTQYEKLYTSREKLVKTVLDLIEKVNNLGSKTTTLEGKATMLDLMKKTDDGKLYVNGIGGYDGTNSGETGILTLQEVIEDLGD